MEMIEKRNRELEEANRKKTGNKRRIRKKEGEVDVKKRPRKPSFGPPTGTFIAF